MLQSIYKKMLLLPLAIAVCTARVNAQAVLPTPEQVAWADAEMGVIIHLDINIFEPSTFNYAKRETLPSVDAFNPTRLNTDQWIRTAKAAGAKYAVLTVKHGTGFSLWPSKVNPYNVGHTKWRDGKADVLKDFLASCKKYDVKPGLYYNTNMNSFYEAGFVPFKSDSAQRAYNVAVLQQLTEIWSNYGKLFEIWFDGGILADEKNGIESQVIKLIEKEQPQAILFQGPIKLKNIIRWVGNEDGIAAYPQWSRIDANTNSLGLQAIEGLNGDPKGKYWCPAESDFPNRRNNAWNGGWLWHAGEEDHLFHVDELTDKYYKSVGRNTNMLIGMMIDTSGLVPAKDSTVLDSLGKRIEMLFSKPLRVIENIAVADTTISFGQPTTIQQLVMQEEITKGENIKSYSIKAWVNNGWKEVAAGESVGHKRIEKFEAVSTTKLLIAVKTFGGPPAIKKVAIY